MSQAEPRFHVYSSDKELDLRRRFVEDFKKCPIPAGEMLANLGLFLNRQTLSRILYVHDLYRRIIDVPGVVMEFGVRWGQNLALFSSFRGMYEPFNFNRKIVGFDTFSGFPAVRPEDGQAALAKAGGYDVTAGYEGYLRRVLDYHQAESPLSHIPGKYELCVGDACVTLPKYLADHPETVVAMAYFDFDLYEPTKACLEAIRERVVRGSVLAFDELNAKEWPGETRAVMEVLGLNRQRFRRSPHVPTGAYVVVE
jgi:hypothetical protein